jgi:hypothetical protein
MADFIRLYVVLIFNPLAAILVPALITWARDLDATARRMRLIDEQSKIVGFWDNWVKAALATIPNEKERDTGTESLIHSLVWAARGELADAGRNVYSIYRWGEYRELRRFKLDFAGFQRFRAALPWYRRAFLLYRSPNNEARSPQFTFHLLLVVIVVGIPLGVLFGGTPEDPIRAHMPQVFNGIHVFRDAHPVLVLVPD